MVSFRGQKKAWAPPRFVSFRGLIQNFGRASPPLSYGEPPPPRGPQTPGEGIRSRRGEPLFCQNKVKHLKTVSRSSVKI